MTRWAVLLALTVGLAAPAHRVSDAYLRLDATEGGYRGTWDVALKDLARLGVFGAQRQISWRTVEAHRDAIYREVLGALTVATLAPCALEGRQLRLTERTHHTYLTVGFEARCEQARGLTVEYRLLFDRDPLHRAVAVVSDGAGERRAVLSADSRILREAPAPAAPAAAPGGPAAQASPTSPPEAVAARAPTVAPPEASSAASPSFVALGARHALAGWDHLLFLLALMLPSVLRRERGAWVPRADLSSALPQLAGVVIAFTLAHAVTLSLAATFVISPPARLVEVAIAASVLLAALNNLVPRVDTGRPLVALAAGLIHGPGFAYGLAELSAQGVSAALLLFNLGVGLAQLLFVLALFPLLFALRMRAAYPRVVMRVASLALCAAGAVWLTGRMLAPPPL